MSEETIRIYHNNGQLRAEIPQRDGRANGLSRDYHPDGKLACEAMYEDGVVHGVAKAWATDGRFLGEYTLDHGTGLAKKWHDNGIPWLEVPFVNGLPTGRQHTWYEDGEPAPDIYWIKGKKVSRKKYHEACKMDSELPYYPESKSK